jgi:hypothetical protein
MADEFNPANALQERAHWQGQYQPDPKVTTPEAHGAGLAAHMARFDAALAADGVTVPSNAELAATAKAQAHGIAHAPDPASYSFDLPPQMLALPVDQLAKEVAGLGQWASASAMDQNLARGLINRLGELTPQIEAMNADEMRLFAEGQRSLLVGVLGGGEKGEAAYAQAVADAKYALTIARLSVRAGQHRQCSCRVSQARS